LGKGGGTGPKKNKNSMGNLGTTNVFKKKKNKNQERENLEKKRTDRSTLSTQVDNAGKKKRDSPGKENEFVKKKKNQETGITTELQTKKSNTN